MKKFIYLATLIFSFCLLGSLSNSSVAFADKQETYGDITYTSNSEGYIHFDSKGNIVESNLENNSNRNNNRNSRAAINHSSGRWVYFSERYDWGKKKKGHSNHYSFTYNRHGSKAKVGGDVRTAGARLKQWAYATAYGKSSDTFSCWYNPTRWY